ncbi:MAG: trigger factor family protein, partial [Paludibacter sp.]|nr:trigger factor family protein [Paludibacter sp.]
MNVVLKNIDAVNAIVTITISKDDYAEKVEKKLKEYRKKANIPGFRPGMTPMNLVKKMYGKGVLAEEVNQLISDTLYNHIKENNLNILGEPLPNETEQKPVNFDSEEDFEFVFDLAIAPEFDLNLNAKDKIVYYDINVTDEMVNNQIKSYTSRFGSYEQTEEVAEKDVIKGQLLELNADKKVNEAGIKVADAVLSPEHLKDA